MLVRLIFALVICFYDLFVVFHFSFFSFSSFLFIYFLSQSAYFKLYTMYCINQEKCTKLYNHLRESNCKFDQFLMVGFLFLFRSSVKVMIMKMVMIMIREEEMSQTSRDLHKCFFYIFVVIVCFIGVFQ